jgi:uncharacterized phage-associated protein
MRFYRKKLLNVILYFSKHSKHLNTTKVFKMLNRFEFDHFKETGYPPIGLHYYTFKRGPVSKEFWLEIKDGEVPEDFRDYLGISIEHFDEYDENKIEHKFIARKKPDMSIFTPREIKILENVVTMYGPYPASVISEASHEKGSPWDIVQREHGYNHIIDYIVAIDETSKISKETAKEDLEDHFKILDDFNLKPV